MPGTGRRQHQRRPKKERAAHADGSEPSYFEDPNGNDGHFQVDPLGPPQEQIYFGVVDSATQTYFQNIERTLDNPEWESEEDLHIFLTNVYGEVNGQELALAADHDCSVVLEKLLRVSSDLDLRTFFARLSGNYVNLFRHYCASHVCQTLVILCADVVERERQNSADHSDLNPDAVVPSMVQLFETMSQQMEGFWHSLMVDRHATYLVRVILNVLAGRVLDNSDTTIRSKKSQQWSEARNNFRKAKDWSRSMSSVTRSRTVPDSFQVALRTAVQEIRESLQDVHLRTYSFNKIANPVLQQLLDISPEGHERDLLARKFLLLGQEDAHVDDGRRNIYAQNLMKDPVGSRLFEKILKDSSANLQSEIYSRFLAGKLVPLSYHQNANYIVQSLLASTTDKQQLQDILQELYPEFGGLLFKQRAMIVQHAVQACNRMQDLYEPTLQALYAALNATSKEQQRQLIWCFAYLAPVGEGDQVDQGRSFSVPGSTLAQAVLSFPEAHHRELVNSILQVPVNDLKPLLKTSVTSYIFDAFLQSPTVLDKAKRKLLFTVLPILADLAVDRCGSHMVERLWALADVATKEKMAEQLITGSDRLQNSTHGSIIWRKCHLGTFARKKQTWREQLAGADRKRDMFKEFLGADDGQPAATKPKRKVDEMDELFAKVKKDAPRAGSNPHPSAAQAPPPRQETPTDPLLADVIGAISASTKADRSAKKAKRKH
ncbi:Nucleolar protein 9 [Sorochytrium milnesiophthora]